MIKNVSAWEAWEREGPLREAPDFQRNLRLLDAMYQLARTLGALPAADPLEGFETNMRVARTVNHVPGPAGTDCPRS